MLYQSLSLRHISAMFIILLSINACRHSPPRVDKFGKPQKEYTYQAPIHIDDGWRVSSLGKEGVNKEIINDLMKAILAGKYPNLYSIILCNKTKSLKYVNSISIFDGKFKWDNFHKVF